jgi:hypothetical protein
MQIKLVATGFDARKTYSVIVVDGSGRKTSLGEFIGTGATRMSCNLNSSVLRADAKQFEEHYPRTRSGQRSP